MTDVLAERAKIEERIAGKTLLTAFADTVERMGDQPAYSDQNVGEGWRTLTWNEMRESALDLAAALIDVGVEPGDRVCIMASNRIEHVLADLGTLHAGAIPVSIYGTLSPDQVAWYARAAAPRVVILEGADQIARWEKALSNPEITADIKAVVVIAPEVEEPEGRHETEPWSTFIAAGAAKRRDLADVVDARIKGVQPNDPVTILFTSGTTGDPKGVLLTHTNVLYETFASIEAAGLDEPGITVSYLPFAHIAERVLGLYVPQIQGGHVHLIADPAALVAALPQVRPTRFFGVPRVWEKIMTGISALLAAEPDEAKKAGVAAAMAVGREYVEAQQAGGQPSPELAARFAQMDELVLAPMRAMLGLDRAEWTVSAAAPMPPEVAHFFAGLGFRMLDVYGMSETTAAVAAGRHSAFRLGTAGVPLPGIEMRLADDGEILARGPVVTPGYFNNPTATADLVDADGWVHTGDIGTVDEDGYFRVVDRKKELLITSSGKNIAPSHLENLLKESPLIGHAMAVGDGRSYVVALLTLDPEIAPLIAARAGIDAADLKALADHPIIVEQVAAAVARANDRLARPEQIKRFKLLPDEWTPESEELTPTLKLKRRVVLQQYAGEIEQLYAD
ncbi:MAG: AMP-dependent synthetase/ligase [Marmoricola sp.]